MAMRTDRGLHLPSDLLMVFIALVNAVASRQRCNTHEVSIEDDANHIECVREAGPIAENPSENAVPLIHLEIFGGWQREPPSVLLRSGLHDKRRCHTVDRKRRTTTRPRRGCDPQHVPRPRRRGRSAFDMVRPDKRGNARSARPVAGSGVLDWRPTRASMMPTGEPSRNELLRRAELIMATRT